jgi:hypothetical protein
MASWSAELASVAYIEGRTHVPGDPRFRRAVELMLEQRARQDDRERREIRRMVRRGELSRRQVERALS